MSIYYTLLGRPISKRDHALQWKKEGLTDVVFRLEFQKQAGRKVRKAVAYAGDHAMTIDSWTLPSDDGTVDPKERIDRMHDAIYEVALKFEKMGMRCRINGQRATDYIRSERFFSYVSGLL